MNHSSAHVYTDKHDATYIQVKEGKLWASDMVKPRPYEYFVEHSYMDEFGVYYGADGVIKTAYKGTKEQCRAWIKVDGKKFYEQSPAMEAFNQSFVEVVGGADFAYVQLFARWNDQIRKGLDGVQSPEGGIFWGLDADEPNVKDGLYPVSGLQFEVREEPEYVGASESTSYPTFRKVAILSIKSQSKCCNLNPNGCEDCTEFNKLNTPPAVAILSLKQEQKEQEPDVGHDDFESASKKVYSKLLSPLKQEQPSEEKEQEWISVKDRLPHDIMSAVGLYLVFKEGNAPFVATFFSVPVDGSHWNHLGFAVFPTHWMPLPEPPKD